MARRIYPAIVRWSRQNSIGNRRPKWSSSGLDAAFVYTETAGAAHVTFFAIYDPSTAPGSIVTYDDVAAHIGSRLGADRAFRSVLARVPFDLDQPYWVRGRNFGLGKPCTT